MAERQQLLLRPQFCSVGVNRVVHALDWGGSQGLIAYGGHHLVCIYDAQASAAAHGGDRRQQ